MTRIKYLFIALLAPFALVGCQGLSDFTGQDVNIVNPVPEGASVDQAAFAYVRSAEAAVESVGDLIASPDTPDEVAKVLGEAAVTAEPAIQATATAFREYSELRAQMQVREESGLPESAELTQNAIDALLAAQTTYEEALPEIQEFLALVRAFGE